jgi:hypothetical protein
MNTEQASDRPKISQEWTLQASLHAHSGPAKAIAKMDLLRVIELRYGRNQLNIFPTPNCEAVLAYTRGQIMDGVHACHSCKRGRGPFTKCVIMNGYLSGSCSNCHYNNEGTRCSFRPTPQNRVKRPKSRLDSGHGNNIAKAKCTEKSSTPAITKTVVPATSPKTTKIPTLSVQTPLFSLANKRAYSAVDLNHSLVQLSQTILEYKWSVGKAKIKVKRTLKLAILYKYISDLLKEEADQLNKEILNK